MVGLVMKVVMGLITNNDNDSFMIKIKSTNNNDGIVMVTLNGITF